jgi:hypothetical protein
MARMLRLLGSRMLPVALGEDFEWHALEGAM